MSGIAELPTLSRAGVCRSRFRNRLAIANQSALLASVREERVTDGPRSHRQCAAHDEFSPCNVAKRRVLD